MTSPCATWPARSSAWWWPPRWQPPWTRPPTCSNPSTPRWPTWRPACPSRPQRPPETRPAPFRWASCLQDVAEQPQADRDQGRDHEYHDERGAVEQPLRNREPGQLEHVTAGRGGEHRQPGHHRRSPASTATAASITGIPGGRNGVAASAIPAPSRATRRSARPAASRGHSSARKAAGPTTSRPNAPGLPTRPAPTAPTRVVAFHTAYSVANVAAKPA